MPTTTVSGIGGGEHVERITPAGDEVVDALLQERRAVLCRAGADLVRREPVQADDLLVERAARLDAIEPAGESEAEVGHVLGRIYPAIDADQCRGREAMRGLFHRLPRAGCDQGFARIEVAGGLV